MSKLKDKWTPDDTTQISTPKIQVITKISKWDKYDYVEMNGMKFICGSSDKQESEKYKFQTMDSADVLIDLLALQSQLQVQFANDEKIISDNITDIDIKNIKKFCNRHGLPRWGMPPINNVCFNDDDKIVHEDMCVNIAYNTSFRDIVPLASKNYLHLPSFIRALKWIKLDFLKIVAYYDLQEDNNIKPLLTENDKKQIDYYKKIKRKTDLYLPTLNPFVTYWDDEKNGLFMNCENLIHLSVYYLCIMKQTGKCGGGYVKICQSCGQPFLTTNANKKGSSGIAVGENHPHAQ